MEAYIFFDKIAKELDEALLRGYDMVRAKRLRGSACPASVVARDVEVRGLSRPRSGAGLRGGLERISRFLHKSDE